MKKSWHIDRRTMLRGAGACLALPFLDSMRSTTQAASGNQPNAKRLVCIGSDYGMNPEHFFPKQAGRDYELSHYLKPMAAHKNDFTVFGGLDHGVGGGHKGVSAYLTGYRFGYGSSNPMYSLDQYVADQIGSETRFASLPLSVGKGGNCSWNRYGILMQTVHDPQKLFDMMFRQNTDEEKQASHRRAVKEASILDAVLDSSNDLRRKLGKSDKRKFEEYLNSIDETQKRLANSVQWIDRTKPDSDGGLELLEPTGKEEYFDQRIVQMRIMYDLLALALQTDSTRIASFHIPGGNASFQIDGVDDGYHSLTHHGHDEEKMRQLSLIEIQYTQELSKFLDRMKSIATEDGNLLDDTVVLYGSGMGNASGHSNRNLPMIVAGGRFDHGRSLQYTQGAPGQQSLCNLYVSIMQKLGIEADKFGPSTGRLTDFT
ncbi:MAG: hypothetical protein COA78_35545 [Blastopirellula sp.]|nr:MAG: hypothetical protein COA78_35545 [Blastopirellula sp.]